jgi:hypothetical protein
MGCLAAAEGINISVMTIFEHRNSHLDILTALEGLSTP